ncbi:MAG: helical backbone metal receptor [Desulfuromonadaceae bacterium]|nr:helical backbone metal receptor [Desulfuromonadaceae bacterium]
MSQRCCGIKSFILCLFLFIGWTGAVYSSPGPPKRIVSLAPAMTEIIFSLGLGDQVVGVTTVCDRPKEARSKTKIGGMANPSLEAIISLKPDIVVLTKDGNPKAIAERLAKLGIKTYVFKSRRLAELPAGIREMGQALGARPAADHLAENIEKAIQDVTAAHHVEKSLRSNGRGRKAVFVIWPSPLIVAGPGTILDDAMKMNGLINIASDGKVAYPRFSVEAVIEREPDLILIGTGHADMRTFSKGLLKSLSMLEAVKKGRVYFMDDALYRPGPRIPAGMRKLDRCRKMP